MDEYDLVAIGGGSGGYTAAIRAAQLGLTAAVVERDRIGGTCLHRGCIPTKVWLETAETLNQVRKAPDFGVRADDPSLDFPAMVERQRQVVEALHKSIRSVLQKHKVEIIEGEAHLVSPGRVAVGERMLAARNVVIATGSRPKAIQGLGTNGEHIMDSDRLLQLEQPPKSIVIVGAGAIGCEFASFFLDIGTGVTLVEVMPTVVPLEDVDVGKALGKVLAARGASVLTSANVLPEKTRTYDGRVELAVEHDGKEQQVLADAALIAVGREAVTEGLGLDGTGVRLEKGFIKVDDAYRTDEPSIYAVGDCIGGALLAHVASAEGFAAGEAIAGKSPDRLDYARVPRVVYTRPQVAAVGLTEEQARESGRSVRSQRFSFRYNAMALIHGEADGFVKIVYDADSGDLLGAHIIGRQASEMIGEAALARFLDASAWEMGTSIHPHPSLSEALGEAAQLSAGISIYR